jgi:uncharacterized membrane protein
MASRKIACFVVPALLALALRFLGLTFDSFWLDEGYQTVVGAYGQPLPNFLQAPPKPFVYRPAEPASPHQMLANFRSVDPLTPPLYQLILNRWITIVGGDDFAVRSLSALLSSFSVLLVGTLAYLICGWRCALFAALLQAVSPFAIYYGQEARMYALEELLAVVSMATLIALLFPQWCSQAASRPPIRRLLFLLYALSSWALLNTHYTGLFLLAAQAILGVSMALKRRSISFAMSLGASWILMAILWLPWLPMFFQAASIRTAAFYVARQPSLVWPFTALFVRIPVNWVMFLSGNHVIGPALPLFATSVIVLLLGLWACLPSQMVAAQKTPDGVSAEERRPGFERARLVFLFWAIVPALILWVLDVVENHRVIELPRYLIATAPAIYLLGGSGLAWLAQRRMRLASGLVTAQIIFACVNNIAHATAVHQREPWRQMAQLVEQNVAESEPLFVSQYYDLVCLDRYLNRPLRQIGASSNTTRQQFTDLLNGAARFALVTAQEGDRILKVIPPDYRQDVHRDLGHSLHFYQFSHDALSPSRDGLNPSP